MSIHDQYMLETPEHVEVQFDLAGPGSRFCAMFIDLLLLWLFLFAVIVCTGIFGAAIDVLDDIGDIGSPGDQGWLNWVTALYILLLTGLVFGYHLFFELLLKGQTPGKRSLRIRAIRDDGTPMSPIDTVIRNLVRLVDFLPAFYGLGGLVMFWSPMNKRLGDLAAGTIVVKEGAIDYRAELDKKYVLETTAAPIANAALTPEERRVLTAFLARRQELLPDARRELAQRLADQFHARHGGLLGDPEYYLERLIEDRHRGN